MISFLQYKLKSLFFIHRDSIGTSVRLIFRSLCVQITVDVLFHTISFTIAFTFTLSKGKVNAHPGGLLWSKGKVNTHLGLLQSKGKVNQGYPFTTQHWARRR